ncbi:MAG: periplasmic heavy metal sensor [Magnetospirillum sp.]|nr:periplasmic heavy metal sensor [Magnetospirillum sp.]
MILDMAQGLPEADARILRQALEAHRPELDNDEDPRLGSEQMRQVLSADPFDLEAFRRMSSQFRARQERRGEVITAIMADALPRMSPEGRRHLADHPPRPPR